MSDNHPALPASFPTRAFVAIAIVWVLIDLPIMLLVIFELVSTLGMENYLPFWLPLFAAKVTLLTGWWVLGEGKGIHRFAGFLLFTPLLAAILLKSISEPLYLVVLFYVIQPPLLLILVSSVMFLFYDCELTRNAPRVLEKKTQFSLRQLMLLTLLIAIVLGLLRWIQEVDTHYIAIWFLICFFGWLYPHLALLGFLRIRLYSSAWYAIAATLFLLALPFTFKDAVYLPKEAVAGYLAVYLCFIIAHVLLLRYLGFRLMDRADSDVSYLRDQPS